MFKPTHKIVTQASKRGDNGILHRYTRGTIVQSLGVRQKFIKVINESGTVQFVQSTDMEAL